MLMREMCKLILATLVKNIDKCKFFANKDKVHRILDFKMQQKKVLQKAHINSST